MAHVTLQMGAAIIVPVRTTPLNDWRGRALREAVGMRPHPFSWPASHVLTARFHGLKIGRTLSLRNRAGAMRSLTLGVLVTALLSGCAARVHPVPTTVVTAGMPNPEEALRQSIHHVDAEMAELGQLTPTSVTAAAPVMPEDLQRTVTFSWSGPLDQGVAKLAQSVGYTLYVTAPPGAQPLIVSVQLANVPAFEVFRAFGEEAGARAAVELDPVHHQVHVIHHV
jgi:defect-in-organelle-trafficking protein DotD